MKYAGKIILSLVLLVVLLITCGLVVIGGMGALWLQTYQAFTDKTLVAEVKISQQQEDEQGEYAEVTVTPYRQVSALAYMLNPDLDESAVTKDKQEYKIYGDTVHMGGPIVRFYDHLVIFNFKTVYKLGTIYGRYTLSNQQELNREQQSSYELNGGIDERWRTITENIDSWPYDVVFDTTQLSTPGQFIPLNESKTYNLYMTVNGFVWEAQEGLERT